MNEKDHPVGLLTSNLRTTSDGGDGDNRVTGVERGEGRWGSRNCGRRRNDGRKKRHIDGGTNGSRRLTNM